MPTFPTPEPIDLSMHVPVGVITIVASDRTDTVVTVAPTDPDKAVDRRGAEETTVDFAAKQLTVTGPKPRWSFIGPTESIDVRVELPTGSRVTVENSVGFVRATGRLGATRIKASSGAVDVESSGDLWVRAGHGSAIIGTADGSAEVTADHGQIKIGSVTGDAVLKASHGAITVGDSGGDLEAKLSYGDLEIATARASVAAKTAYGTILLGEVSGGSIDVESGYGAVTLGVKPGVPAWLDLSSKQGRVRNELEGASAPEGAEQTVAIRARTQFGDITVRHARGGA